MALEFRGIEPVKFGGKECVPKITTEVKLRLSQIKEYSDTTDDILASAFPNDEAYVRNFLDKMSVFEKQTLHAYLVGGFKMVEYITGKMDTAINEAFEQEAQND